MGGWGGGGQNTEVFPLNGFSYKKKSKNFFFYVPISKGLPGAIGSHQKCLHLQWGVLIIENAQAAQQRC